MVIEEPSALEVFITVTLGDLASGMFKEYIDRLPLKGCERVLELGPSAGNSTRPLAQRLRTGGCVTAVDISQVWASVARKRLCKLPNVEILLGDITTLPIADQSYDALFFSFVLHEIPPDERLRVMKFMLRKLIPGGQVFLREPLRFINAQAIHQLICASGLIEIRSEIHPVFTQGPTFEGIFQKPARGNDDDR